MSHKLGYENAPADNLKTWAGLQKVTMVLSVVIALVLLTLFFAFVY